MPDWTYKSELENAKQKAEEFSQKASKALEDGDQEKAEQLLSTADTWQTLTRAWEAITKDQTFTTAPPNFDLKGLRELQAKNLEARQKWEADKEKRDKAQSEFMEKIRQFNEWMDQRKKKWAEDDAKRKKMKDEDQPPQEPEPS